MILRNLIFLYVFVIGALACAQPKFVADTDIHKTGEIQFQRPHTMLLGFTNKGTKALHIKKVVASCGCTKVKYPHGNIAPGDRGEIEVTFDAAMLGSFNKYIEVFTNAGKEPEFLSFQGRVVTEVADFTRGFPIDLGNVRMNTNYIEYDNVRKGDVLAAELSLVNTDHLAYRPQLMHLPPYLTAQYVPENIPGGKTGVIRLILDTNGLETYGLNQTSIYLARFLGDRISESNEIVVSSVLVPAVGETKQNGAKLVLSTDEIVFDGKAKKPKAVLKVSNEGTAPLTIHNLQVFNHAVEVALSNKVIQPGKSAKLSVSVKKSLLERFKARPRVLLVSDDADTPVKIVNIRLADD
jgi:hypothetical protein